jgi:predicted ATP-binding protein involved in virulence
MSKNPQKLRVRKLDPKNIKPHRLHLIVGKRGCGKTTLLKDLMYHLRNSVDFAMAMCPTMESASMLRSVLPECCVFDRYVGNKVDQLVQLAQQLVHSDKKRSFLLIADDVLYDRSVLRNPSIRNLFFNGRHLRTSFIILAQYMMDLTPDLRAQIDYLYVMRDNIVANRQRLYKNLFGCVSSFENFQSLMDNCTQNYECLCLDNTVQTVQPSECIFWYKAQMDLDDFSLGRNVFFDMTRRYKRKEPLEESCEAGSSKKDSGFQIEKADADED